MKNIMKKERKTIRTIIKVLRYYFIKKVPGCVSSPPPPRRLLLLPPPWEDSHLNRPGIFIISLGEIKSRILVSPSGPDETLGSLLHVTNRRREFVKLMFSAVALHQSKMVHSDLEL